ncbi:MAG: DMT family transporter, partial [Clostridia bacterium]|nr:DMT family transporter [Clostridia bacterium]
VLAILLFQNDFGFQEISKVPWYLFLGGILGILITFAVIFSIPRAGVAAATTAIIVGQVGTALLIDHLGLFHLPKVSFAWPKLVGLGLLAAGALLMLRH